MHWRNPGVQCSMLCLGFLSFLVDSLRSLLKFKSTTPTIQSCLWEAALMALIGLLVPTHFSMWLSNSFHSRARVNVPTLNLGFRNKTCFGSWNISWRHKQKSGKHYYNWAYTSALFGHHHDKSLPKMTAGPERKMRDNWAETSIDESS